MAWCGICFLPSYITLKHFMSRITINGLGWDVGIQETWPLTIPSL